MPMSDAAISACCSSSSVMPTAAKIASSRVGGSRRTRRVPYFVFQSSLMVVSRSSPSYLCGALLHCNANLIWQVSYARPQITGFFAVSYFGDRISGRGRLQLMLRPPLQRCAPGLRQPIDPAFGAVEPAIDIVQQDLPGLGNVLAQIPHPLRPAR